MDLKIVDFDVTFKDYFEKENISISTQKKLKENTSNKILFVPGYDFSEYYFEEWVYEMQDYAKKNLPEYDIDILADSNPHIMVKRSAEWFIPTMLFLGYFAKDVAKDLVVDFIKAKMKNKEEADENERDSVSMTIIDFNSKKKVSFRSEIKDLGEVLEKVEKIFDDEKDNQF